MSALLQVVPGAAWGSKRNKRLAIKGCSVHLFLCLSCIIAFFVISFLTLVFFIFSAVLEVLSLHSHETRSISHLTRGIKASLKHY